MWVPALVLVYCEGTYVECGLTYVRGREGRPSGWSVALHHVVPTAQAPRGLSESVP